MNRRNALAAVALLTFLAVGLELRAQGPVPTDPDSLAQGNLPGTYPTTVTAANMKVEQSTPATIGGDGSDNLRVTFPSAGPIKWTESRHNEGDISLLIGPGDPNSADYFPPNAFVNNYKPLSDGEPFAKSTIGWRVNNSTGALLATVRHNGVDFGPGYTFNGQQVGTVNGVAYFNRSGSGFGYSINDGVFRAGGSDLQMGVAGFDENLFEANFDVAANYFPYEQGWVGAWVNSESLGTPEGEATFLSSSVGLPTSSVNWVSSQANVVLPGVNSATDGMLFVAPSNGDSKTDVAAAFPNAGGWTVAIREDESADFSGATFVDIGASEFQFLYVPYTAHNLIGGHVQGSNGSLINSAGEARFDLTRNQAGQYALSVFEADGVTKLSGDDGTLILSVASTMATDPALADRSFMSYEYDDASGDFVLQSRQVTAIGDPGNSDNVFGDVLSLTDTNFYFAWVDFENPLAPAAPALLGDYNDDGSVDAADYTVWRDKLGTSETLPNDDIGGTIGEDHYTQWKTNFGSAAGGAGSLANSAVPEPSTLALCGLVAVLFGGICRRTF